MGDTITRGELARRGGVGIETVRFYERKGLLDPPPRSAAGYRLYGEKAVTRLFFIRRAVDLGFSLRDVQELIALRLDPSADCSIVQRRAEKRLVEIREKLRDLRHIEAQIEKLIAACRANDMKAECPLLESLHPQ